MQHLVQSDLDSFGLFELTPDLVCIAGKDGYFKKVNQAVLQKFEYSETELFARPISAFMHPDDTAITAARRAELLSGKVLTNFQNRYFSKSGNLIWLQWTSVYLPAKEIVFAIAKDITESKQAEIKTEEEYIKFKSLATHFKNKIEKDRKYFAFELHEDLAQLASAIKMDIESIDDNTPDVTPSVKEKISNISVISKLLMDTIKRIAFSVSPYVLEDLGLHETLQWLCKEFSILNNVPCNFESSFNEAHLTHEMKLDFFRICQESLSNVMRHAEARTVTVTINENKDKIYLYIVDDGKGFKPADKTDTPGLTIMRKLTASIDAELIIKSVPGNGTTVCVVVGMQLQPEFDL